MLICVSPYIPQLKQGVLRTMGIKKADLKQHSKSA